MGISGLLHLLLFLSTFHHLISLNTIAGHPDFPDSNPTYSNSPYIESACRATLYYPLCVRSLSPYSQAVQQSDRQLAQVALAVTLPKVRSAAAYVSHLTRAGGIEPRDSQILKDCIDNMGDSVDQLRQSMLEMGRMGSQLAAGHQNFMWHMSNVQTWVSAALTDENTCVDGFSEPYAVNPNIKAAVRRRVLYVAQVTSNALALINSYASSYRP